MNVLSRDQVSAVEAVFQNSGVKVYAVGGCVRDALLGIPAKDVDFVVVGSSPKEMVEKFGFTSHGIDHTCFILRHGPLNGFEFSLARKEKKVGTGYTGFQYEFAGASLHDDLFRRDLTINAMAQEVGSQDIIDPFGGQNDLQQGVLRHVSEHFSEDPVRILRVARFAARYDFLVHPSTMKLMHLLGTNKKEILSMTSERVGGEFQKALATRFPHRFFWVLRQADMLEDWFPQIHDLFGIPQPRAHHPEIDVGVHVLNVVKKAGKLSKGDPLVVFGALVHDLGKALSPVDWGEDPEKLAAAQHLKHEEKGVELVRQLCNTLRLPNTYKDFGTLAAEYHTHVHRISEMNPRSITKFLLQLPRGSKFRPTVFRLARVALADATGRGHFHRRPYPQALMLGIAARAFHRVKVQPAAVQAVKDAPAEDKKKFGDRLRDILRQDQVSAVKRAQKKFPATRNAPS